MQEIKTLISSTFLTLGIVSMFIAGFTSKTKIFNYMLFVSIISFLLFLMVR
ncbi:MAG: hypothetical protein RMJ18_02925 [Candidatus Aenigmarchaeota archaeon]|nr:hypothetical protein [Candidatus Aenigmarchaeota archaeon]MCX8191124.1 hypothetical protein [Candidatus Aenigmarchaeota archaeon]MDW8160344.1 hypothetical protein [Candidatus Aenigmarchaeota archaeon]